MPSYRPSSCPPPRPSPQDQPASSSRPTSRSRARTPHRLPVSAPDLTALALAIIVVVVVVVALLLDAFSMAAADASYPGGVIHYEDRSGWSSAVELAVNQWNRADIGVTMRRAAPGEKPDIIIETDPEKIAANPCSQNEVTTCAAFVSAVGIKPGQQRVVTFREPSLRLRKGYPSGPEVRLVVHELGHILGLQHTRESCDVMNPIPGSLPGCASNFVHSGQALCGPVRNDVTAAARVWGGDTETAPSLDIYCADKTVDDMLRQMRVEAKRETAAAVRMRTVPPPLAGRIKKKPSQLP